MSDRVADDFPVYLPRWIRQWAAENAEFLDRVVVEVTTSGRWPSRRDLQRTLLREGSRLDVRATVADMPRPLGHESAPDERVVLLLFGLRTVPAADPILDAVVRVVQLCSQRFQADEFPALTRTDVSAITGEGPLAVVVSEIVRRELPFLAQRGGDDAAWTCVVSDLVVPYVDVASIDDYLERRTTDLRPLPHLRWHADEDDGAYAPAPTSVGASDAATSRPVTAFITWAHTETGWSRRQEEAWRDAVLALADALCANGIEADVDLFHQHEPGTDWTRFGPRRIRECDFVLVALTKAWRERWDGDNDPTVGAGVAGEANALRGLFRQDQREFARKTVLVALDDVDPRDVVPDDLHGLHVFCVGRSGEGLDALLRTLTRQPQFVRRPLGPVPNLGSQR